MLYAILCYDSENVVSSWSQRKDDQVMTSLGEVQEKLAAERRLGPVARLADTATAKTIRKGKQAFVMDGPFAETKEQLLGFYVVECESMDAALEVARELAAASGSEGAFELRPLRYYRPGVLAG